MIQPSLRILVVVSVVMVASAAAAPVAAAPPLPALSWVTVVNNTDAMPGDAGGALFNSYNQPSVNDAGLVVLRARAKGGTAGEPPHGIYTRDMASGAAIAKVVDRTSLVPAPNNTDATFVEYPAFPRIDLTSGAFAFRGNSAPVWQYGEGEDETAGTTGVYAKVGGALVTGASKLGTISQFGRYAVPGLPGTGFEVFPGAPSVTGSTIVFKGNYTHDGIEQTGAFFRVLSSALYGGTATVKAIATSSTTRIPGTSTLFGSISPPSAAKGMVAFAGYDNEASPTLGGIYLAKVAENAKLKTVAAIGARVPDGRGRSTPSRFTRLGEAVSFDGRFVAFWGAWGTQLRSVVVTCPTEGNKARQAFCLQLNGGSSQRTVQVPVNQGMFVRDVQAERTYQVAKTGPQFADFVYWAFTGSVTGSIEGDDGEPAAWRASAYVAVSGGERGSFRVAFKGTTPAGTRGVYLAAGPGVATDRVPAVVDTTMPGSVLDPAAAPAGSVVTEVGLERDGFRGQWLVLNAKMLVPGGAEASGMAGIYAARVSWP